MGLFFDFDGTIALSEPVHMAAWEELSAETGLPLPEGFLEKGVGATDAELAQDLALDPAWRNAVGAEVILERKRALYQRRCRSESVLVPGVVRALERFAARFPLAICTSASVHDVTPTLEAYGLRRFFRTILTIEDVVRAKPDPEIYLKAAMLLGCDPCLSFAFEDSPKGAAAGRAAGMRVVGMTTTFPHGAIGEVSCSIADYTALDALEGLLLDAEAASHPLQADAKSV